MQSANTGLPPPRHALNYLPETPPRAQIPHGRNRKGAMFDWRLAGGTPGTNSDGGDHFVPGSAQTHATQIATIPPARKNDCCRGLSAGHQERQMGTEFLPFIYLFIGFRWVLVAAGGLLSCGMQTLSCSMHVGSSSLTRDRTRAPCIGSTES